MSGMPIGGWQTVDLGRYDSRIRSSPELSVHKFPFRERTPNNSESDTLCAFSAGYGRDECALARGGHCQGPGMARTRQRLNDAPLRPAQEQAGRQSDISGEVLRVRRLAETSTER
jgi:hypothetical protein